MCSVTNGHDPVVLQPAIERSRKTNRRLGGSVFDRYQRSYHDCRAALAAGFQPATTMWIQAASRFAKRLRRSYGADNITELPTARWAVDRIRTCGLVFRRALTM
jgi:hypothetical protein